MNFAKKLASSWLVGLLLCTGSVILSGCYSTVIPHEVVSHQASFDQGAQNSGLVRLVKTPAGVVTGVVLTTHAMDRYNSLAADYGTAFKPAVKPFDVPETGQGVTDLGDGTFLMDAQHFSYFAVMQQWRRNGRPPIK